MKRNNQILLAVVLAFLLLSLTACTAAPEEVTDPATTQPQNQNLTYSVTVVDVAGNPYTSDVIVRFLKDGEQIGMQPVNEQGVAAKELEVGTYTFELVFTGDESVYHYDKSDLVLTEQSSAKVITLNRQLTGDGTPLFANGKETSAYRVDIGGTFVSLASGERNYFLFAPSTSGTYSFTSDSGTVIGYYGAPHFVQELSAVEVVDNSFTLSISAGMIGGTYVIGVDAGDATECTLSIVRIGDPQRTIADEPWNVYEASVAPQPYKLSGNGALIDFDLTAEGYNLVLNEADGYYHLDSADGPVVLVRLGVASAYLESFKVILEHTGVNRYFFDDEGAFVKKESYSECLLAYIACMDEDNGVYPLTEDLKYIIQQEGEDSGWWDPDNSLYLFVDGARRPIPGINTEIAWLFMCCYQAQ